MVWGQLAGHRLYLKHRSSEKEEPVGGTYDGVRAINPTPCMNCRELKLKIDRLVKQNSELQEENTRVVLSRQVVEEELRKRAGVK